MNKYEEELQKSIDSGQQPAGDDLDIKAYNEVFLRLRKMPEIQLSRNFADVVVAQVIEKRKKDASGDYFWFGLGVLFLLIAFVVAIVMSDFKFDLGFLKGMSSYAGLSVFVVAFIFILNRFDKKLIYAKIEHNK